MSVRLRDVPLIEVVHALFQMTGQGFVLDGDVLGHADVELVDVSVGDLERALGPLGLSISRRRLSDTWSDSSPEAGLTTPLWRDAVTR